MLGVTEFQYSLHRWPKLHEYECYVIKSCTLISVDKETAVPTNSVDSSVVQLSKSTV